MAGTQAVLVGKGQLGQFGHSNFNPQSWLPELLPREIEKFHHVAFSSVSFSVRVYISRQRYFSLSKIFFERDGSGRKRCYDGQFACFRSMRLPMTAVLSRQGQRRTMQEEDDDSPAKCRERRRRRIERRRLGPPTAAGPSSSASPASGENPVDVSEGKRIRPEGAPDPTSSSSGDEVEAFPGSPSVGGMATRADVTPVYGMMSVAGRSRDMEDAIHVQTNLCRPEFNRRLPVHYFGVYDGHGGTHVKSSPPNPFAR